MQILLLLTLLAQASPPLRFDAASVRPSRAACQGRWDFSLSHGALTAQNAPLLRIISRAYNLTDDRVSGPVWLDSECYDIHAKAGADVPDSDVKQMLQSLLSERFHLVVQRGHEERPVFALLVDKGGPKIRAYGENNSPSASADGRTLFMARHMPDLCERLGKVIGQPVIDKTGLDGDYLIRLTYTRLDPDDAQASSIFSAVRDQLGLKLESQHAAVETLKIVSVDRTPRPN
jgi:uncharacterized protein (TIGR03435 family)